MRFVNVAHVHAASPASPADRRGLVLGTASRPPSGRRFAMASPA
jgi:hypothetical protein